MTNPSSNGWQLLGDGPEAYERYIVPAFSGIWAQDMVKRAELHKGDRILDLACGTGIVARHALKFLDNSCQVTGIDVNAAVLEKAREICSPDSEPVTWQHCDAMSLPFSDAEFEVVLCQQGLQYFSDRLLTLREIVRVLSDGGRALFSVWRPIEYFPFYTAVQSALDTYVSSKAAGMLASAFTLGNPEELRTLLEQAGFKRIVIRLIIKQMRYDPVAEFLIGGFVASPFAPEIVSLPKDKRTAMFQTILESVSKYIDDRGLAAPMESYVVSGVK